LARYWWNAARLDLLQLHAVRDRDKEAARVQDARGLRHRSSDVGGETQAVLAGDSVEAGVLQGRMDMSTTI